MKVQRIGNSSIKMINGEGEEYLRAMIGRMSKQQLSMLFLDIVCRPNQIAEARRLLGIFYELVSDLMPLEQVAVAISCDPEIRPTTMALAVITHGAKVGMYDINPERG